MTWYRPEHEIDWWRSKARAELADTKLEARKGALEKAIEFSEDREHSADARLFVLKDALASGGLLPTEAEVIG